MGRAPPRSRNTAGQRVSGRRADAQTRRRPFDWPETGRGLALCLRPSMNRRSRTLKNWLRARTSSASAPPPVGRGPLARAASETARSGDIYKEATARLPSNSEKRAAIARETAEFLGKLASHNFDSNRDGQIDAPARHRRTTSSPRAPSCSPPPCVRTASEITPPRAPRLEGSVDPRALAREHRRRKGWRANAAPGACAAPASYDGRAAAVHAAGPVTTSAPGCRSRIPANRTMRATGIFRGRARGWPRRD